VAGAATGQILFEVIRRSAVAVDRNGAQPGEPAFNDFRYIHAITAQSLGKMLDQGAKEIIAHRRSDEFGHLQNPALLFGFSCRSALQTRFSDVGHRISPKRCAGAEW
jgi:hypothetical protein